MKKMSAKVSRKSTTFDSSWYLSVYPDVAKSGIDPLTHYWDWGVAESRNPNSIFDTRWYLKTYPDVAVTGLHPLVHFETVGWREGYNPGPNFSARSYQAKHLDGLPDVNPVAHFLNFPKNRPAVLKLSGKKRGVGKRKTATATVSALFDAAWYLKTYPEVVGTGLDPLEHYMREGVKSGYNPNAIFDTDWYLDTWADVAASGMNPLIHFENHGWKEERDPGPAFSMRFYRRRYLSDQPDVNPAEHYLNLAEEHRPLTIGAPRLFDRDWYLQTYPDAADSGLDPFDHYIVTGATERRNPNALFDTSWYLKAYPAVKESGLDALSHYELIGSGAGYDPCENFTTGYYAYRYREEIAAGELPLLHYMKTGRALHYRPVPRKRILVVSVHCPTRAHAGGLRILDIYQLIRNSDPDIYIELFTQKNIKIDWNYDDLDGIFHKVYEAENYDLSVQQFLSRRGHRRPYDVIDLEFVQRLDEAEGYRQLTSTLLFTPMECLAREYAIRNGVEALSEADIASEIAVRDEVAICQIVDNVICVSNPDAAFLRENFALNNVTAIETGVSELEFGVLKDHPIEIDEATVLFLAYFGSPTNVEALEWYFKTVHPLVKAKVPGYKLQVVGRGDLSKFTRRVGKNVELVGEVATIFDYIARATVGVSPALSGAGFRGKINQYARMQLPTVASSLAATGFHYLEGEEIFVHDDPYAFAGSIIELLTNRDLRNDVGRKAQRRCLSEYSWQSRKTQILSAYHLEYLLDLAEPCVEVIVPSYRHGSYLRQRIDSIYAQTYKNFRVTVIDDNSTDNSDEIIRELNNTYDFDYIRREANSGTPFSAWKYAAEQFDRDLVWICESDDFAESNFLETAVDAFSSKKDLALFYVNSWVVDADGMRLGTTASYFSDIWQEPRWGSPMIGDGIEELVNYQRRGMMVPNMSSAVIKTEGFRTAYGDDLKRYRLTGDWLFIGRLLTTGSAAFSPAHLSNFRTHIQTARSSVPPEIEQAEFVLTKFQLTKASSGSLRDFVAVARSDIERFHARDDSAWSIVAAMWRISKLQTAELLLWAAAIRLLGLSGIRSE